MLFNILSMLGHSLLGIVLVKLNLKDKLGDPEHHRVASLLIRNPGSYYQVYVGKQNYGLANQ